MTATFRGQQGLNKMKTFLKDVAVVKMEEEEMKRNLALDVHGRLKADDIKAKVLEVALLKQQELPVIIILPSIDICEEMREHF